MREDNPSENRSKASRFADQNQPPKLQNAKGGNPNNNHSKPRLWGAHIVKGFSADKKTKQQSTVTSKKQTLTATTTTTTTSDVANQKNPFVPAHSRVKRSLMGDLSCSMNGAQVHPHAYPTHRRQSSTDLFTELDHMRSLLQESKERESNCCPANSSESDIVAKIKAEASLLRLTNEDLCKQVEGLQTSRLNEVEELAYLRWVNACLRNELKNTCSALDSDKPSSPHSVVSTNSGDCVSSFSDQSNRYANRFNLMKKPKKWPITSDHLSQVECPDVEKRALRIPNPPPRPSCSISSKTKQESSSQIKADIETQGEFVNSLIREVNNAVYQNIEDVVAFVKWLDDELCFLKKADTLREAAFGYQDLKKLESEVSSYKDDPRLPCDVALKKMVALSEKMERTVYTLLRTRDSLMRNCKEFQIPIEWMLDNGIIGKIKLGSVKLAKKYMKRVAMELQAKSALDKDPAMDYMLLQGVRFAFRIHQFAGGFDAETMHAFEELRNLASLLNKT
ncbi:hypothetical protein SESBI_00675 [Sesbania bispinosa]|nr:hypothetical protein SESBI_00675 [Sesbania bispinosa]